MIRKEEALEYHRKNRAGKIEVKGTKPCSSPREIRLAYLPGALFPATEIRDDSSLSYSYTSRGNLVGVISNGTSVPGLGDVGPFAVKAMQEGIGVLFKRLADIDVFDLELDARDPDHFVSAVRMLEPTFGGINLKDIRAPEGLEIYDRLCGTMKIPVFHENLYSTAVVAIAVIMNALELSQKKMQEIRVVISGAGTVGLGCARLMTALGIPQSNLLLYDIHGLIHPEREDLNSFQKEFASESKLRTLMEGIRGSDVFVGASAGGILTQEMIRTMNPYPVVLAMATPEPEITYEEARNSRRDVIVATSQPQFPNAILDLLSFPYIFRGALDVHASRISNGMMLAAARALADLAKEEAVEEVCRAYGTESFAFGPEYLLPKPVDPRILARESGAVAQQAISEGIAGKQFPAEDYMESVVHHLGTGREMMLSLVLKARRVKPRIVLPEGNHETILRACSIMMDEGIACPVLLGNERNISSSAERVGIDVKGMEMIDPARSPEYEGYAEEYFRLRSLRGVTRDMALRRLNEARYFGALMLHKGDADMMICGIASHFAESLSTALEVIGPVSGVRRISSLFMACRPGNVYFLADCAVNINPDAEDLAEIALLSASVVRSLAIEPRIAMLSFSNFGSADHPYSRKVREATRIVRERSPGLIVEGEIQLATALDSDVRKRYFPFSRLETDANVLIFPDLQSGNLALHVLQKMGDSLLVGPVLMGARKKVHVVQYGSSADDIVNLAAMATVVSV